MKMILAFTFLFLAAAAYAQKPKEYDGCLFGFMPDTICGKVTFNLYGENKDMVTVKTRTVTQGRGRKTTESRKVSYHPGIANVKLGSVKY